MKLVAARNFEFLTEVEDLISKITEGIIVFPENSFEDFDLNEISNLTLERKVTLIGTRIEEKSKIKISQSYFIKSGSFFTSQSDYILSEEEEENELDLETYYTNRCFRKNDKVYNFSPTEKEINGIIRICETYQINYNGNDKYDLFISSSILDQPPYLKEIINTHGKNMKENTLIVISSPGKSGIFNMRKQFVGKKYENYVVKEI